MEAVDTQDGSYAWRSILVGREVLKEGMRWRVGDGTSIRVWSNPWLPSPFLPFFSRPRAHGLEDLLVASLIDSDSNRWHSKALQNLFMQRDVELIESIPLSSIPTEDTIIWPFTPTCVYSVKSEYNFLFKSNSFNNNEYHPESNKLWKKVWALDVQPKIRNFLWRAIKNSIPWKANLKHGKILRTLVSNAKLRPRMWCTPCGLVHH